MITFFTIPREMDEYFGKLQRTAFLSWKTAVPGADIILMGDEPGIAEVCKEMGLLHVPELDINPQGTPLFNGAFRAAEQLAEYDMLCEISADIIISAEILSIIDAIKDIPRPFVVGQRTDIDPGAPADTATLHSPSGIDYFLYRKGTLGKIPDFAVGRTCYDQWMLWAAMHQWEMTAIDATADLLAVHVNHGYPLFPGGRAEIQKGVERAENIRLARESGCTRWMEITDTPYVLENGLVKERVHA